MEFRDRMKFVKKVYSILAVQLNITAFKIIQIQTDEEARSDIMHNPGMIGFAGLMSFVFCIMIFCCFSRKFPLNYLLLLGFTVCEAYCIAGATAWYNPQVV